MISWAKYPLRKSQVKSVLDEVPNGMPSTQGKAATFWQTAGRQISSWEPCWSLAASMKRHKQMLSYSPIPRIPFRGMMPHTNPRMRARTCLNQYITSRNSSCESKEGENEVSNLHSSILIGEDSSAQYHWHSYINYYLKTTLVFTFKFHSQSLISSRCMPEFILINSSCVTSPAKLQIK